MKTGYYGNLTLTEGVNGRCKMESCAGHDSRPRARREVHVRACGTSFVPAKDVNEIGAVTFKTPCDY